MLYFPSLVGESVALHLPERLLPQAKLLIHQLADFLFGLPEKALQPTSRWHAGVGHHQVCMTV